MRLVCLMLMGVLAAQDLQTGESRQPKMKRKFNLSYYDLPKIDNSQYVYKRVLQDNHRHEAIDEVFELLNGM